MILSNKQITKALIRLCEYASWSAPFGSQTPEGRFSCVKAHILTNNSNALSNVTQCPI